MATDRKRLVVIGLGGIGSELRKTLLRFLNFDPKNRWHVVLVDGDTYEEGNATRQTFGARQMRWFLEATRQYLEQDAEGRALLEKAERQIIGLGNKAETTLLEVRDEFPNILFEAIPAYVSGPNDRVADDFQHMTVPVTDLIRDGDIVMLCVDNHKTRLNVSRHCQTLRSVRLISGGNDIVHGNAQLYVRHNGNDLFQPLEVVHPEIAEAANTKAPHEMSCEELAASGTPQIVVTNNAAANDMLRLFYAEVFAEKGGRRNSAGEIYSSIVPMGTQVGPASVPFERKPTNSNRAKGR